MKHWSVLGCEHERKKKKSAAMPTPVVIFCVRILIHLFLVLNFYCHCYFFLSRVKSIFVFHSMAFRLLLLFSSPAILIRPSQTEELKKKNNNSEFKINCEIFWHFFFALLQNQNKSSTSQPHTQTQEMHLLCKRRAQKCLNVNFIQKVFMFHSTWLVAIKIKAKET